MKRMCITVLILMLLSSMLYGATARARISLTIIDPPSLTLSESRDSLKDSRESEFQVKNPDDGVEISYHVRETGETRDEVKGEVVRNRSVYMVYN